MTAAKPLPPHGKRARYLRGCRCLPCIDSNKRYCKHYRAKTVNKPVRIDATPVRERLQQWVAQGYSQTQIGDAVGKKSGDISKLLAGQPTIAPSVAARILRSSGPTGHPMHARVDSTGTIRRGRALHAIGYPIYMIAAGVPMATNHLGRLLDHEPTTVSVAVARGMAALYKQWSGRPGPSHFAVFNARRHGWHSPLSWDDIDDPACEPELADPYTAVIKYERDPDKKAEIEHLYLLGESVPLIAKQLGDTEKYVRDQLTVILRDRAKRAARERAATSRLEQAA
ncbi:hypothetical protein [Streptomyces sp. SID8499]|uniref:hypothetical protein n=1 Tax=Streptomyces sp. SID8499 TaxID=2706106 RepID=UPI0013C6062D|nr:hypothetical protein [Streptomyces sp. SID8499]NED31034.1 hypothetical protein [Streptomyces sp. SID8499]